MLFLEHYDLIDPTDRIEYNELINEIEYNNWQFIEEEKEDNEIIILVEVV